VTVVCRAFCETPSEKRRGSITASDTDALQFHDGGERRECNACVLACAGKIASGDARATLTFGRAYHHFDASIGTLLVD
jgi:hypothetical protein